MYTADGILHITNWYAFAIAVIMPGICSAEAALDRYYDGPGKRCNGKERYEQLCDMRDAGIPWREIAESMGYKSVDSAYSIYTHGKERYGK